MRAVVCASQASADSIAVVAWFPTVPGVVVAEHSSPCWYIVYHSVELASAISFQGRVLNARNLVLLISRTHSASLRHTSSSWWNPPCA